jgi:nitrogen fixation protein
MIVAAGFHLSVVGWRLCSRELPTGQSLVADCAVVGWRLVSRELPTVQSRVADWS